MPYGLLSSVHEITASHWSLSGTISCVTDRIRFLPITMTSRFSNFNSISYKEDRHELRLTNTKCRLPGIVSGTGEIFMSGADHDQILPFLSYLLMWNARSCKIASTTVIRFTDQKVIQTFWSRIKLVISWYQQYWPALSFLQVGYQWYGMVCRRLPRLNVQRVYFFPYVPAVPQKA